jgi:hypothetical protein
MTREQHVPFIHVPLIRAHDLLDKREYPLAEVEYFIWKDHHSASLVTTLIDKYKAHRRESNLVMEDDGERIVISKRLPGLFGI